MTLKKKIKLRIKGWFPQEPISPLDSTKKLNHTQSGTIAVSTRKVGLLGLGSFLSGFALLAIPYFLSPSSYIPKTNSAWGYSAPKTIEAWIALVAAIGLILLSVFAFTLFGVKLKTQDSKWMKYSYWIASPNEEKFGKHLFKVIMIANIVLVGAFLGFVVYSSIILQKFEALLSVITIFTVLIAAVNVILHGLAKKTSDRMKGE
jgi:hypothetical protein